MALGRRKADDRSGQAGKAVAARPAGAGPDGNGSASELEGSGPATPGTDVPHSPVPPRARLVAGERVEADDVVTPGIRIAAAWSWRIIVVIAALIIPLWLIAQLRELVIPLLIAVLIAALLIPFVDFLMRHRWPKWAAVA